MNGAFAGDDVGLVAPETGQCGIVVLLTHGTRIQELFATLGLGAGGGHVGLGAGQGSLGIFQCCLVRRWIDLIKNLAFLDLGPFAEEPLHDDAVHARPHLGNPQSRSATGQIER